MPKVPPAPPIFSITSVWPSVRDIWSPTSRVTTSVGPPAANGTITVIGLLGYWATAGAPCNASASRLPAIRRHANGMVFLPRPRRRDDGEAWPFAQVRHPPDSNHLIGLVVGLAVAAQRGGPGAGVKPLQAGRDLGVLAFEQAVAGKIALDQEWPEPLHVEHPHRLRQPELFEPVDTGDALDTAAEQRAGAVSDRGEIDRLVGNERLAIDLRGHPALANDDVAARERKPAVEPLGETERRSRGHRTDGVAAVGVDRRRGRAMEIGEPERVAAGGHSRALLDRALIHAFARREDAAGEIGDRADFQAAQILGPRRKTKLNRLERGHPLLRRFRRGAPPFDRGAPHIVGEPRRVGAERCAAIGRDARAGA